MRSRFGARRVYAIEPNKYRGVPDEDGRIDHFFLGAVDGRASLAAIARRVKARFPGRFADLNAAMTRVGALSVRYTGYESR